MSHVEGLCRKQPFLLPPKIEVWIPGDHPARVVNMFVETVDTLGRGIREGKEELRRPNYGPKVMLKVLLYGTGMQRASGRAGGWRS